MTALQGASSVWLQERNPTVKVVVVTLLSLVVMFLTDPVTVSVVLTVTLGVVTWGGGVPMRTLVIVLLPFVGFGVGVFIVNAVTRPGEVILTWGTLTATREGVHMGVALALRTLIIGALTVAFLASTPPRDLMVSLQQHARLSPRFAAALMAGHRILDSMPHHWSTIRAAHAVRAARNRAGKPRFTITDFGRCAFALLVTSIRSSERVALALEVRGLTTGKRSVWKPVALTRTDVAFAITTLLGCAVIIIVGTTVSHLL